jgi:hypothetical protein
VSSQPEAAYRPIDLETFAIISAEIAEGDRSLLAILDAHELTENDWLVASMHYNQLLAADDAGAMGAEFSAAFTRAQDALRPLPAMEPEDWAELQHLVATNGNGVLASRGLSTPDFLRLSRHWAKRLGKDPPLAKRYHRAFFDAVRRLGKPATSEPPAAFVFEPTPVVELPPPIALDDDLAAETPRQPLDETLEPTPRQEDPAPSTQDPVSPTLGVDALPFEAPAKAGGPGGPGGPGGLVIDVAVHETPPPPPVARATPFDPPLGVAEVAEPPRVRSRQLSQTLDVLESAQGAATPFTSRTEEEEVQVVSARAITADDDDTPTSDLGVTLPFERPIDRSLGAPAGDTIDSVSREIAAGLALAGYALISAELIVRPQARSEVLKRHMLSEDELRRTVSVWSKQFREDPALYEEYRAALAKYVDRLGSLKR